MLMNGTSSLKPAVWIAHRIHTLIQISLAIGKPCLDLLGVLHQRTIGIRLRYRHKGFL